MENKFTISILVVLLPLMISAQKGIMDIHGLLVNATSDQGYESATRFGGGIGFDFYVNENLSLGIEGDYLGFRFAGGDSAVNIIPVQALVSGHWNLTENFDLFAGTGAGFFWHRYKDGFSLQETSVIWGITPRVGLNFEFAQNVFLNTTIKYSLTFAEQMADDANGLLMLSIGLGYNINAEL